VSGPDPEVTRAAEAALDSVASEWMSRSGVISVEVARRRQDGVPTDEIGIRVTVERKLAPDEVPEGELFPSSLEGIPVDVVEGRRPQLEEGPDQPR
jgi:hypothetical protein